MTQGVLLHCQLREGQLEVGYNQGVVFRGLFMAQGVLLHCQLWEVEVEVGANRGALRKAFHGTERASALPVVGGRNQSGWVAS